MIARTPDQVDALEWAVHCPIGSPAKILVRMIEESQNAEIRAVSEREIFATADAGNSVRLANIRLLAYERDLRIKALEEVDDRLISGINSETAVVLAAEVKRLRGLLGKVIAEKSHIRGEVITELTKSFRECEARAGNPLQGSMFFAIAEFLEKME